MASAGTRLADEALRSAGIEVVILTGDNERTARAIARQRGMDRVLSKVLLDDKAQEVQKLQVEGKSGGMVGDGVNDATALAQADVDFAIGTGTDVAIDASDVTLIKRSLMCIITPLKSAARRCATMRNVRQILVGACGYNALGVPAMGILFRLSVSCCRRSSLLRHCLQLGDGRYQRRGLRFSQTKRM
jgi:P-type Cu+ transporter